MSSELCSMSGVNATSEVIRKLQNPSRPMKVGGFAIDTILFVTHTIEDGQPVVECLDDTGEVRIFQFDPSVEPFRNTAVDIDGLPVCIDC